MIINTKTPSPTKYSLDGTLSFGLKKGWLIKDAIMRKSKSPNSVLIEELNKIKENCYKNKEAEKGLK